MNGECSGCGMDDFICQLCAALGCETPTCPHFLKARWVPRVGNVCTLHSDEAADQEAQRRAEKIIWPRNGLSR